MLVTKAEILNQRSLSDSLKDKEINQFIDDAELVDLRPLIGEEIYVAVSASPSTYSDLLNGSSYTYGSYTYSHPGIKSVLIDFIYARYRLFGDSVATPYGMRTKNFDNGNVESDASKYKIYSAIRKVATSKWGLVHAFLSRNSSTYPLFFHPDTPLDNDEDSININKVTLR